MESEILPKTRELCELVSNEIDTYRPMSPPVYLLRLHQALNQAISEMTEKVMGDRTYG